MNTEREMLKYVRPSFTEIVFATPLRFALSAILIIMSLRDIFGGTAVLGSWLMLLCGLFFGLCMLIPFLEYRSMMYFLNSKNIYEEAVADFSVAQPFMNDRIRLGNKFMFGGKHCAILRYADISRVYQYSNQSIFYSRELHAFDTSGKHWRLCSLRVLSNTQPELQDVLDFMRSKNNTILSR